MHSSSYEYDNSSFSYRNFFIRLIVIICIILLIFWLISIFSKTNRKDNVKIDNSEVFHKNLDNMKNAALNYFNEDNIPNEAVKTKKISLKKLQEKDLIKDLYDSNAKKCSNKKSYVRLSKSGDKYILKTNLTCGNESDYIISHLVYSTDCDKTFLCEVINVGKKDEKKTEDESITNTSGDVFDIVYPTIRRNNSSSKKTRTKTTYTKKRKPITDKNTKGKIIVKNTTNTNKNVKLSDWSLWSNWEQASCSISDSSCDTNDASCLSEVKTYSRKEKISTTKRTYTGNHLVLEQTNSITESECPGYNYVIIDGHHYRTESSYYTLNNYLLPTTASSISGWTYNGRASYDVHMNDTINTKYIFVSADYSNCNGTCTSGPKYIYDKYTYSYNLEYDYPSCSGNDRVLITIPVYRLNTKSISVEHDENLYGTVCYMSKRTRTVIDK